MAPQPPAAAAAATAAAAGRPTPRELGLLLAVTTVAAALRFWDLGAEALWADEASSLWYARLPGLSEVWDWPARIDFQPPLYFVALHLWRSLFGESEAALRSLSAVAATLTVPVVWALGRVLGGPRVGGVAALLLSVGYVHVRYAREGRNYAVLTLVAAVAMLGLAVLLRSREEAARLPGSGVADLLRGRGATGLRIDLAWLALIGGCGSALLIHNTALFLVASVGFVTLGAFALVRPLPWRLLRSFAVALGAVLAIWATFLPGFLRQSQGLVREYWMAPPTPAIVANAFGGAYAAPLALFDPWLTLLGSLLVIAGVLLGLSKLRGDPLFVLFALGLWLTLPLGEIAASVLKPVFLWRTLIWSSLPVYLLIGAGLRELPRRKAGLLLSPLVALHLLAAHDTLAYTQKEPWRHAVAFVAERVEPTDLILFVSFSKLSFDYYFERTGKQADRHVIPADLFEGGVLAPRVTEAAIPRLEALAAGHRRVWLINTTAWYTDPEALVPRTLARLGRLTLTEERLPDIPIYLYDLSSPE